jgi:hypothetical protein
MTITNEREEAIRSLRNQIEHANQRCDTAYANFDIEAYEGACNSLERLGAQLRALEEKNN